MIERTELPTRTETWRRILVTCSAPKEARIDPISRWLVVTRACVQPMTLTSVAVAGLLAVRAPGFEWGLFILAAIGLVVAHAANNMINDYFDLGVGLDTEAYPRALYAPHPVLSGLVTKAGLLRAIAVANVIDAAIMIALFVYRGWPVIAFALGGLFISVFYVAPPLRLKHRGLGEPSVFIIWGPLMVGGTYYAAVGTIPLEVILASLPYAFLVASVLMGKHIDKAPWDKPENIRTVPVLLGDSRSRAVTAVGMLAFYLSIAVLVTTGILSIFTLVAFAALPVYWKARRAYAEPKPEAPPEDYPLWPLWFAPWAFLHARRAGALFVLGLMMGALWPSQILQTPIF
ncbi:MAG: prenyltransferase [Actinobacteria bacterium]|nr:prenyltransferase [Actinomycetota bacterium]